MRKQTRTTHSILCMFIFVMVLEIFPCHVIAQSEQMWSHTKGKCEHGIHHQPNGPMAIMLFCEDAVGTYLGLIYYDIMEQPAPADFVRRLNEKEKTAFYNIWSLSNRMWQEPIWASDVTSYAWGEDGTKLYIATSGIYGSGSLYELDIVRRQYKQIVHPEEHHALDKPGPGYVITKIESGKLFFKSTPWDMPEGTIPEESFYEIKKEPLTTQSR